MRPGGDSTAGSAYRISQSDRRKNRFARGERKLAVAHAPIYFVTVAEVLIDPHAEIVEVSETRFSGELPAPVSYL